MANIKNKLNEIKDTISNQDEATKVMAIILEVIEGYEDKLAEVEERQSGLEEKVGEIFEMLSDMEEELVMALNEDFDGECPYCGETITFKIPEDGKDVECPKCHNMIELEEILGDCDCDCDDCDDDCDCDCDDCDGHCDHDDEE